MSDLFFPHAFLTGTLQNHARANKIAIDRLSFDSNVIDDKKVEDIKERPSTGIYVYGLFLEGCRWDPEKHVLASSLPKEVYFEMPAIHFVPVADRTEKSGVFTCPIYKVLSRRGLLSTTGHSTNFVLYVDFLSEHPQDHWVKADVAGFLALKY